MTTLEDILSKCGVPRPLKPRPDDASGFIVPFHIEGMQICEAIKKTYECRFTFVEGLEMQAVAIQDEMDVVAVYAGMFWLLCRLASTAAGSGVFPVLKGSIESQWRPDIDKSMKAPRTLLEEGKPFDWLVESASWNADSERQMLFLTILSVLFRFVTYHEAGHLWYDHGRHRRSDPAASILIDTIGAKQMTPEAAIASQAREIIADSFAFERTIKTLDRELEFKADLEMTKILRATLLPDQEAIAGFVLTIVFLYFRVSDLSSWQGRSLEVLSHPPAPFRAKAVAAALLEHRHLAISERAAELAMQRAVLGSEALLSVMLGIYPNRSWLDEISTVAHDEHFKRIYDEIPRWVGPRSM